MKKCGLFLAILALVTVLAQPAHATVEFKKSWWRDLPTYNEKVWGKFRFGFFNATLGWLELGQEPYQAVKAQQPFWHGLGHGLFNGIVDTVGGLLHILTFPITQLDIPLPEGGSDTGVSTTA